jgi:hypothetical protein
MRGACVAIMLLLAACGRSTNSPPAAPAPAPAPAAPSSHDKEPASTPAAASGAELTGNDMPRGQTAACLAQRAATQTQPVEVHRWTDASGITHYSDQAPESSSAVKDYRVLKVEGLPPVRVSASGYDMNLPDNVQQRAVADALGVERVFADTLHVRSPDAVELRVLFVRDADAYAKLVGDPVLATSVGAYSTAKRTLYVRAQEHDEASFAILRHEITHALIYESVGNLPTALNEGLAEYFGRYRVGGMGAQIDMDAYRKMIVATAPTGDGSDALVDLLARDGDNFYAIADDKSGREQRYTRAYALVALLMDDTAGRAALSAVLAAQSADPCRPVDVSAVLNTHYPGGLVALTKAWVAFMRDPPSLTQSAAPAQ